ncbi:MULTISPECIES: hypothetical protein [Bacillaceae]|uniref:Uncharacterized protein n=1 Tax=Gottfriedia luciferensis TaxID=178774 RepID=A0ABX2ZNG8_9BACI|nr:MULTISPECIES: hypothetical protein [Bacillaceae]ODG90937.1 hypothetical protein BED47_07825 [Gottfriedia luciferensis]PET71772.1 hypothetical protein CN514_05970 [Bacillus sp. AFS001701]PGZ94380.1 hypothetical protein COE53_02840 [Bacillus sp. AFS029533]SFC85768.1 hypothetical protein SAMN02799633_01947 [Bacillus sp. UNCCL81]
MSKESLLKNLRLATRGNYFLINIKNPLGNDKNMIEKLAKELELDGKIKLKECTHLEDSIFLSGILKFASN